MMRRIAIAIGLIIVPLTGILSQQVSHQVIVPVAGIISGSKISYSQTVGETAVEIMGCSAYLFTQGFQQPCMIFSNETRPAGNGVRVYPNPVSDYVVVEFFGETSRAFRIDLIDITGTVALSKRETFDDQYWYRERLEIGQLIRGFYLVRIKSDDGMIDRSFKIEKI
jgi:hypothetical protein